MDTAFGRRPLIYADYTASGRSLTFIEDFIRDHVMPYYANTHTETSFSGAQTTALREEARAVIKHAVNADDNYKLIFCGSGATAAIIKLIDIFNMRLPADLAARYRLLDRIPAEARPVVFVGPYEHHSNELPWRESIADVVAIPLDEREQIDLQALQAELEKYADRPLKIGSFSAASNVTGLKTDVQAFSRLLHKHGALALWDYAAAAPYVGIDVLGTQDEPGDSSMDAVFISPHKFIGGPGSPGILVVRKSLMNNSVPAVPGGGTVDYVTPNDHLYISDPEHREEGGTPGIIESIRAGLAFQLQQSVGTDVIEQLESDFVNRAITRWGTHPNIKILGTTEVERLSIISFLIIKNDKYLHHSLVVALLNDVFGIQARGGCSCAGPYGHWLLDIDPDTSLAFVDEIRNGNGILKPGWIRVNFNYFIEEETFEYIIRAVELIADHGWKLLPDYDYNEESGAWLYRGQAMNLPSRLDQATRPGTEAKPPKKAQLSELNTYLKTGEEVLRTYSKTAWPGSPTQSYGEGPLRWYLLPEDIKPETEYGE